jgi:hypothetical protein
MSFVKTTAINSAALALNELVHCVKIYDAIALISKIAFFVFLSKDRILLLSTKHSFVYYI